MGCEIHLYIEKKCYSYKDKQRENGVWVVKNPIIEQDEFYLYPDENYRQFYIENGYLERDYELFGVLAGVRREDLQVFNRKGLPVDCSRLLKDQYKDWGEDAHSVSYLTLAELKTYFNAKNEVTFKGMIEIKQYKEFLKTKKSNKPNYDLLYPYCRWTTCEGYTSFEEKVPISFSFKNFYDEVISKMEKLKYSSDSDEDIRIVFWFDN